MFRKKCSLILSASKFNGHGFPYTLLDTIQFEEEHHSLMLFFNKAITFVLQYIKSELHIHFRTTIYILYSSHFQLAFMFISKLSFLFDSSIHSYLLIILSCVIAICTDGCHNGGTCVSPETCRCKSGWRGSKCRTGENYVLFTDFWIFQLLTCLFNF